MREINENDLTTTTQTNDVESTLAGQIPEYKETAPESAPVNIAPEDLPTEEELNAAQQMLGHKLQHKIGGYGETDPEADKKMVSDKKLTKVGENMFANAAIREGWMDVDKALLGERAIFYPEDWNFRVRPATVEAIRNWSTIDDENPNSVDDVFNEILKSCFSIMTSHGPLPWNNLRSWDRFFFVLLIREYTFAKGEAKMEFTEPCTNCDNDVTFTLTCGALGYDMPDPDVMKYYDREAQNWMIDPNEYEIEWPQPITLYLPTLEKDANIKQWMMDRLRNNRKVDSVFVKFLSWMAPKISKDLNIATRQIREYEVQFNSWDTEMFSFMNDVVKNISVTPETNLHAVCPTCGEEVTAQIRFQDGIHSLFNVARRSKKFGKK